MMYTYFLCSTFCVSLVPSLSGHETNFVQSCIVCMDVSVHIQ